MDSMVLASDSYREAFRYGPVFLFFLVFASLLIAYIGPSFVRLLIKLMTKRDMEGEFNKTRAMEGRLFSDDSE